MARVLVVGGTGMLGGMVTDVLSQEEGIELAVTARDQRLCTAAAARVPTARWLLWDVDEEAHADVLPGAEPYDWVINCVGVIKPYVSDGNAVQVSRAIRVNALFPHRLRVLAAEIGARVIQIATDCVYSGKDGNYGEDHPHDALDVYGKTKSLGEVTGVADFHNIRCSIIGPEPKAKVSLLEWFLKQPQRASVTGFLNHRWNGVTTLHFAKVCAGVVRTGISLPSLIHLVPTGHITKADMLAAFASDYGRGDITVDRGNASTVIDRTLVTRQPDVVRALWDAAGYAVAPTVPDMIHEVAMRPFKMSGLDRSVAAR